MEEKNTTKRREWVKNAAIIFLTIMLLLTFFSNTIMNYSLPEVATQYVQTGTITAKVRGTGKVEASDPYNVIAKESRVITSVAVKQGDTVEKDQVIYYLEDAESDELTQAEKELEDLELNYMKGLFGANVSSEVITKVANGNIDSFSQLQAKVTDMQRQIDNAETRVKECQANLDQITLNSTKNTNDASVSTIPYEKEVAIQTQNVENATTAETNAQTAFENEKKQKLANIAASITEVKSRMGDLSLLINNAENIAESVSQSGGGIDVYIKQREDAAAVVAKKLGDIFAAAQQGGYQGEKDISSLRKWCENKAEYVTMLTDYDAAVNQYSITVQQVADAMNDMSGYDANILEYNQLSARLAELEAEQTSINAVVYTPGDSVKQAKERLNQANQNLTDAKNNNSQIAAGYANQIASAEAALKNANAVLELLKQEQTSLAADINAELDLSKTNKDIQKKKAEIEKLKEKSMGSAVKAPVAGTVSSVKYVAGETTKPEDVMAVIQPEGKGFTLSISVTNEQAKKVQIGDMAELQNSWYYDDARVMLSAIKPDPDKPGTNKLLVFDVSGSTIQADQSLSISVGQRSQEYELVVPNSAIREDNDGKFILTVESKSSPLGNRYIATRVGVEVLASDDNNSAISAPLYGYEYVITTSTKPVEAGKQVRLANNS